MVSEMNRKPWICPTSLVERVSRLDRPTHPRHLRVGEGGDPLVEPLSQIPRGSRGDVGGEIGCADGHPEVDHRHRKHRQADELDGLGVAAQHAVVDDRGVQRRLRQRGQHRGDLAYGEAQHGSSTRAQCATDQREQCPHLASAHRTTLRHLARRAASGHCARSLRTMRRNGPDDDRPHGENRAAESTDLFITSARAPESETASGRAGKTRSGSCARASRPARSDAAALLVLPGHLTRQLHIRPADREVESGVGHLQPIDLDLVEERAE